MLPPLPLGLGAPRPPLLGWPAVGVSADAPLVPLAPSGIAGPLPPPARTSETVPPAAATPTPPVAELPNPVPPCPGAAGAPAVSTGASEPPHAVPPRTSIPYSIEPTPTHHRHIELPRRPPPRTRARRRCVSRSGSAGPSTRDCPREHKCCDRTQTAQSRTTPAQRGKSPLSFVAVSGLVRRPQVGRSIMVRPWSGDASARLRGTARAQLSRAGGSGVALGTRRARATHDRQHVRSRSAPRARSPRLRAAVRDGPRVRGTRGRGRFVGRVAARRRSGGRVLSDQLRRVRDVPARDQQRLPQRREDRDLWARRDFARVGRRARRSGVRALGGLHARADSVRRERRAGGQRQRQRQ